MTVVIRFTRARTTIPAGGRTVGTVVTTAPFPPDLDFGDVAAMITSYSFDDGLHVFTPANSIFHPTLNPGGGFRVRTDAAGNVLDAMVVIMSPLPPHAVNGTIDCVVFGDGYAAFDRMTCVAVQGTPAVCSQPSFGATAARVFTTTLTVTRNPDVVAASAIPTLAQWSLVGLAAALALLGAARVRRGAAN